MTPTSSESRRQQLEQAILETKNSEEAAKLLGVSIQTVYTWIARFGLTEADGSIRIRKIKPRLRAQRSTRD